MSAAWTSMSELVHWVLFHAMQRRKHLCNSTDAFISHVRIRIQWIVSSDCPFLSACWTRWPTVVPSNPYYSVTLREGDWHMKPDKSHWRSQWQGLCFQRAGAQKVAIILLSVFSSLRSAPQMFSGKHCASNIELVFIHWGKKNNPYPYPKIIVG